MWSKKERRKLADRLNKTELRAREATCEIFKIYDIINKLDLSTEVKTELWKRMIHVGAIHDLTTLDLMVIREKLEA